jgi:isochorismate synthase
MQNFALYRLPYSDYYTEIRSDRTPLVVSSFREIGNEEGFVVAPFDNSDRNTPIVLIRPDKILKKSVGCQKVSENNEKTAETDSDDSYKKDFSAFHSAITDGTFHKIVLSRMKHKPIEKIDCEQAFLKACHRYPRLMVMLICTPQTGMWLVASPEILITGNGNGWRTMALAGTMPFSDGFQQWSHKNQEEQHYVETYIDERIGKLSSDVVKDGPHTKRAGNLVHLCTDFRFRLRENVALGDVIESLHPTPAVCGIPKEASRDFIIHNEHTPRLYYSGFMGPVGIDSETHLYVSLRCARLDESGACLYSGGGIMPDSELQSEWRETEQKMKTIGNVLE